VDHQWTTSSGRVEDQQETGNGGSRDTASRAKNPAGMGRNGTAEFTIYE